MSDNGTSPIKIEYPEEGTYVVGGTGMGKSSFLAHRMLEDHAAGRGFTLVDPKEDLSDLIYSHIPDVTVLDVAAGNFSINLFYPTGVVDVDLTADRVMQVFSRVFGMNRDTTARLRQYVRNTSRLLIQTHGTMFDMPAVLIDQKYRDSLLKQVKDSAVLQFWAYHDSLPVRDRVQRIESTYDRVDEFLGSALARAIFGNEENTIDWPEALETGQTILVRLSNAYADLSTLVGAVVMSQLSIAALSRKNRDPYSIYCDEYHRFATDATDDLLTQGRAFGVATTVAHQYRGQLDIETKGSTLQCGNILVFRVSPPDNDELAGMFKVEEEEGRVIGRIAKQGYSPDPVQDLLVRGHSNAVIRRFVSQWLIPIEEELLRPNLKRPMFSVASGEPVPSYHDYLRSLKMQMNLYFVDSMRSAGAGRSPSIDVLVETIWKNLRYAGLDSDQGKYGAPGWVEKKWEKLKLAILFGDYRLQFLYEQFDLVERTSEERESWSRDLEKLVKDFIQVGRAFANEPLMVDTHEFEEMRERPRSVDDRISENANKIANLPRGSAFVRYRDTTGRYVQGIFRFPASPPLQATTYSSPTFIPPEVEIGETIFFNEDPDEPPPPTRA